MPFKTANLVPEGTCRGRRNELGLLEGSEGKKDWVDRGHSCDGKGNGERKGRGGKVGGKTRRNGVKVKHTKGRYIKIHVYSGTGRRGDKEIWGMKKTKVKRSIKEFEKGLI